MTTPATTPADGANNVEQVRSEVDAVGGRSSLDSGSDRAGNLRADGADMAIGLVDDFRGDDAHLVSCIKALISLSDEGALVPHGIGGHARALLSAAAVRLSRATPSPGKADAEDAARYRRIRNGPHSDRHGDVYAMVFMPDGDTPIHGAKLDSIIDAALQQEQDKQ